MKQEKTRNYQDLSCAGKNKNDVKKLINTINIQLKDDQKESIRPYEKSSIESAEKIVPSLLELKKYVLRAREKGKKISFRKILKESFKVKANRAYEFLAYHKAKQSSPNSNVSYSGLVVLGQALDSKNPKRKESALSILESQSKEKKKEKPPMSVARVKKTIQESTKADPKTAEYSQKQLDSLLKRTKALKRNLEGNKEIITTNQKVRKEIKNLIRETRKEISSLSILLK